MRVDWTRKGRAFNINSFGSLLKNRKYIGEYRYQDVVIADGVPAIVPEDLFYRVQERMEKNRHAPAMSKAREDYLLTTKLFCGKCERMMVGEREKPYGCHALLLQVRRSKAAARLR